MTGIKFGAIEEQLSDIKVETQWEIDSDCSSDCKEYTYSGDDGGAVWHNCTLVNVSSSANTCPWW